MPSYRNDPVVSATDSGAAAAVSGEGSTGSGVYGKSKEGQGVVGESTQDAGVLGRGPTGGRFEGGSGPAVEGIGIGGEGVRGVSHNGSGAVVGINDYSPEGPSGFGGHGGAFESEQGEGVRGTANNPDHGGVVGVNTAGGFGIYGLSEKGQGVVGESYQLAGVFGRGPIGGHFEGGSGPAVEGISSSSGPGGSFESAEGEGVRGTAKNINHGGVVGVNTAGGFGVYGKSEDGNGVVGESYQNAGVFGRGPTGGQFEGGSGPAVYARSGGTGPAGHFDGNVVVTGDIELAGADLAEQFGVVGELAAEPGCVVVLAGDDRVRVSDRAYDRRVAGVVSGAGSYRPALILDRQAGSDRRPLALTGKVWCNAEADSGPIAVGDLLTTSATPGHAMRASDQGRAFGAVIGKALGSLESGRGLLPILVALQ
jgi:hypothetical protein